MLHSRLSILQKNENLWVRKKNDMEQVWKSVKKWKKQDYGASAGKSHRTER